MSITCPTFLYFFSDKMGDSPNENSPNNGGSTSDSSGFLGQNQPQSATAQSSGRNPFVNNSCQSGSRAGFTVWVTDSNLYSVIYLKENLQRWRMIVDFSQIFLLFFEVTYLIYAVITKPKKFLRFDVHSNFWKSENH